MDKKEIVAVVLIILVLVAVLVVSGVFYFNMVFSDLGLSGRVVQEEQFRPMDEELSNSDVSDG